MRCSRREGFRAAFAAVVDEGVKAAVVVGDMEGGGRARWREGSDRESVCVGR